MNPSSIEVQCTVLRVIEPEGRSRHVGRSIVAAIPAGRGVVERGLVPSEDEVIPVCRKMPIGADGVTKALVLIGHADYFATGGTSDHPWIAATEAPPPGADDPDGAPPVDEEEDEPWRGDEEEEEARRTGRSSVREGDVLIVTFREVAVSRHELIAGLVREWAPTFAEAVREGARHRGQPAEARVQYAELTPLDRAIDDEYRKGFQDAILSGYATPSTPAVMTPQMAPTYAAPAHAAVPAAPAPTPVPFPGSRQFYPDPFTSALGATGAMAPGFSFAGAPSVGNGGPPPMHEAFSGQVTAEGPAVATARPVGSFVGVPPPMAHLHRQHAPPMAPIPEDASFGQVMGGIGPVAESGASPEEVAATEEAAAAAINAQREGR